MEGILGPGVRIHMVDNHHPETESKPLTTELEVLAPEATAETNELSSEFTSNPQHQTLEPATSELAEQPAAVATATAPEPEEEPDYDEADFAEALANFDREQAAETAVAQSLTAEEVIVTGTVVKITDKHVVVDIGLKSEGLIPLEQVLD